MTAAQLMHEITLLPPAERDEVARFARQMSGDAPMSGGQLTELARRMVEASDSEEARRLKQQLVNGFFGDA